MNWLARLKKIERTPGANATKPTEPPFVGFVAPIPEPFEKTGGNPGRPTIRHLTRTAGAGRMAWL